MATSYLNPGGAYLYDAGDGVEWLVPGGAYLNSTTSISNYSVDVNDDISQADGTQGDGLTIQFSVYLPNVASTQTVADGESGDGLTVRLDLGAIDVSSTQTLADGTQGDGLTLNLDLGVYQPNVYEDVSETDAATLQLSVYLIDASDDPEVLEDVTVARNVHELSVFELDGMTDYAFVTAARPDPGETQLDWYVVKKQHHSVGNRRDPSGRRRRYANR